MYAIFTQAGVGFNIKNRPIFISGARFILWIILWNESTLCSIVPNVDAAILQFKQFNDFIKNRWRYHTEKGSTLDFINSAKTVLSYSGSSDLIFVKSYSFTFCTSNIIQCRMEFSEHCFSFIQLRVIDMFVTFSPPPQQSQCEAAPARRNISELCNALVTVAKKGNTVKLTKNVYHLRHIPCQWKACKCRGLWLTISQNLM